MFTIERDWSLYEAIKQNSTQDQPGLRWLLHQPNLTNGRNQLEEYEWVVKEAHRRWHQTCFQAYGNIFMAVLISSYLTFRFCNRIDSPYTGVYCLLTCIVVFFAICMMQKDYISNQEEHIELWIKDNWKTKWFPYDVRSILQAVNNSISFSHLEYLMGTDREKQSGLVPGNVETGCRTFLTQMAIRMAKPENQQQDKASELRADFNDFLNAFKRHKILPENACYEQYRQKAEKAKKQLVTA